MQGYGPLERAVINQMLRKFPAELDANRVQGGDIDTVLDAMFTDGFTHGCVFEMGGGREGSGSAFERDAWVWSLFGYYIIRYTEDMAIEAVMRDIVSRLSTLFDDNRRLNDLSPLARITRIEAPEPVKVNDIPFYWITFIVDVIDRG